MTNSNLLSQIKDGFNSLGVDQQYKDSALVHVERWLTEPEFADFVPQIEYLVENAKWDMILDCFYQIIPFGTGGRRGLVGIGPNRINTWTIQASAQGHSQYLISKYGDSAKNRGVVIAYDVREYLKEGEYDNSRLNPVYELNCKMLAQQAAVVYAANGLTVWLFDGFATTPELSFSVRHLKAVAGDMVSASHNPPEYNGKKVVDETGGQLIPPHDQELVDVVVNQVKEIKKIDFDIAKSTGLIKEVPLETRQAYLEAAASTSISDYRGVKILYSPFHGTSFTSVPVVLKSLGFDVTVDETSGKPDPKFSSITFNIPNPEVEESYLNLTAPAEKIGADIIMVADPDGDRVGLMSKEKEGWHFFNGNEIYVLIVSHMLEEMKKKSVLNSKKVIIKTLVTTNLISVLAKEYGVEIIGNLLVGIKYIGSEINKLEQAGRIQDFLIGGEESHGSLAGNYLRDKDSCVPGILLAELASKLKLEHKTLKEYLDDIYLKFGYFRNYLTEIRLPGAEGMTEMAKIQQKLRTEPPKSFGNYLVESVKDEWSGSPFLSETDKVSRNVLTFNLKPTDDMTNSIIVTVRPSGTEPKTKMYIEIGRKSLGNGDINMEKQKTDAIREDLEKSVIKYCYKLIGIDFPDRAFLLFWQLAAQEKMKYFDIEPQIEALKNTSDPEVRKTELNKLLKYFGSDPITKIDRAFKAKNQVGILEYLSL
ncbi:MAG: phospho-sugar mutase [Candidatus Shapirobacteria bacterium]